MRENSSQLYSVKYHHSARITHPQGPIKYLILFMNKNQVTMEVGGHNVLKLAIHGNFNFQSSYWKMGTTN